MITETYVEVSNELRLELFLNNGKTVTVRYRKVQLDGEKVVGRTEMGVPNLNLNLGDDPKENRAKLEKWLISFNMGDKLRAVWNAYVNLKDGRL